MHEDLAFLKTNLEEIHPNLYFHLSRDAFEAELARVRTACSKPLQAKAFSRLVARMVAKLGDGHTGTRPFYGLYRDYKNQGGLLFPFRVEVAGQRVFVRAAPRDYPAIVGAEISSVNGVPIRQIVTESTAYISAKRRVFAEQMLRLMFGFYLWYSFDILPPYRVEVQTGPAQKVYELTGVPQKQLPSTKPRGQSFEYRILNPNTAYLYVRTFSDAMFYSFERFLRNSFADVKKRRIKNVIIDIRENDGGNSQSGDLLFEYLSATPYRTFSRYEIKISKQLQAEKPYFKKFEAGKTVSGYGDVNKSLKVPAANPLRFKGTLYLLIGPFTFSAAADFAAMVKDFQVGILVGEQTGGLATSYGDTFYFKLPRSGLSLRVSYKYFVRPSGADDGKGVLPDHKVVSKIGQAAKGSDPVLKFAEELATKKRPQK